MYHGVEDTFQVADSIVEPAFPRSTTQWYATQTRPRHEKKVAAELIRKGIDSYLPLVRQVHRWSDRRKEVEVPLFAGYVFVNAVLTPEKRLAILTTSGILTFVGAQQQGTPIPEQQIQSVRLLLAGDLQVSPYPFLKIGQRVVIRSGALAGIEGILVGTKRSGTFVISIDSIQQSLAFSVEGYDIQPL